MIRSKKGFTLIEIVIVIVIIGVLATLTLPKITGQIEASRAAEAMSMFGIIKRSAEQIGNMTNNVFTDTGTFAKLGIQSPASGSIFRYYSSVPTPGVLRIRALSTRVSRAYICMEYNPALAVPIGYGYSTTEAGNPYAGIVTRAANQARTIPTTQCDWAFANINMETGTVTPEPIPLPPGPHPEPGVITPAEREVL
jgi:prepilin-type N-terminal cleavage/methylation domain-containing protein